MKFAIEITHIVPICQRHTYEAETLEQATVMAIEDQDWNDAEEDWDRMMVILRRCFMTGRGRGSTEG